MANIAWPVIATPRYAEALGAEAWGVTSLALLVQLGASLLEQGFSQGVMRDLAAIRHRQPDLLWPVLKRLERAYLLAGVTVALLVLGAAWPLSAALSERSSLPINAIASAIAVTAAILMAQIPAALFRAALLATEHHVANSLSNIVMQSLRYGGGLFVALRGADATQLLAWFAGCALWEALIRRVQVVRCCARAGSPPVPAPLLDGAVRDTLQASIRMAGAVLMGAASVYLDRFIVGQSLPLKVLGTYTLASTAALGIVQAIYPLGQIALPRMVAASTTTARRAINARLVGIMALAGLVGALAYVTAGPWLIRAWLHSEALATQIEPLLSILLWGSLCNALFNIGYWNWMADGNHRAIRRCFMVCMVASAAVTPVLTWRWGAAGAAFGWVTTNVVCLVGSLGWTRPDKVRLSHA